jgi:hypothetical protein
MSLCRPTYVNINMRKTLYGRNLILMEYGTTKKPNDNLMVISLHIESW